MQDSRDLKVWQKAHAFALEVYRSTNGFPKHELYSLTSQLRRCAASIPSNLAEGSARGGDTEFARFCRIAMGSAAEAEYQLLLAYELGYLDRRVHERLAADIGRIRRMLWSLLSRLQEKQ